MVQATQMTSPPTNSIQTECVKEGRPQEQQTGTYPTLNLIAYTDDPGFFVSSDDADADFPRKDHSFPTLQWFGRRFGISKDDVAILDASTFNRWVSEENRFPQKA